MRNLLFLLIKKVRASHVLEFRKYDISHDPTNDDHRVELRIRDSTYTCLFNSKSGDKGNPLRIKETYRSKYEDLRQTQLDEYILWNKLSWSYPNCYKNEGSFLNICVGNRLYLTNDILFFNYTVTEHNNKDDVDYQVYTNSDLNRTAYLRFRCNTKKTPLIEYTSNISDNKNDPHLIYDVSFSTAQFCSEEEMNNNLPSLLYALEGTCSDLVFPEYTIEYCHPDSLIKYTDVTGRLYDNHGDNRPYEQKGSHCGETSRRYSSTIYFKCESDVLQDQLRIHNVVRVEECKYEVLILTSLTCAHPVLREPFKEPPEVHNCYLNAKQEEKPSLFTDDFINSQDDLVSKIWGGKLNIQNTESKHDFTEDLKNFDEIYKRIMNRNYSTYTSDNFDLDVE